MRKVWNYNFNATRTIACNWLSMQSKQKTVPQNTFCLTWILNKRTKIPSFNFNQGNFSLQTKPNYPMDPKTIFVETVKTENLIQISVFSFGHEFLQVNKQFSLEEKIFLKMVQVPEMENFGCTLVRSNIANRKKLKGFSFVLK